MKRFLQRRHNFWHYAIYHNIFKKNLPMTYLKANEAIDDLFTTMISYTIQTGRPVEIKKTVGYFRAYKAKGNTGLYKMLYPNKTPIKKYNHDTFGYFYKVKLEFSNYGFAKFFKFRNSRKTKQKINTKLKTDNASIL